MSAMGRRAAALLGTGLLLASAGQASAHEFQPCLLAVRDLGAGRYEVTWRVAPGASETGNATPAPTPVFPAHCRRVDASMTGDRFTLSCDPPGLDGHPIAATGLLEAKTDVVVRFTRQDGTMQTLVLRPDSPEAVITESGEGHPPFFSSRLACARTYLGAGVEHILRGFDHLLFIAGLMLLVKQSGTERRAAALLRTITAFTAAHSVTLALSALGVVRVPPAPVEAMIALSIFFLAVELTRADGPRKRPPWVMAFAFGLLHGFGFAGALSNLGLPAGEIPLSLLMFNLGVELGQLAFVLVMALVLRIAGAAIARAPRWATRAPAYILGSLAATLCIERVFAFWA